MMQTKPETRSIAASGDAAPRGDTDILGRVQYFGSSGDQAVSGENGFGGTRGHTGKTGLTVRKAHVGRLRQPEGVVAVEKDREHVGPADNCGGAGANDGRLAGLVESGARRGPERLPGDRVMVRGRSR